MDQVDQHRTMSISHYWTAFDLNKNAISSPSLMIGGLINYIWYKTELNVVSMSILSFYIELHKICE